MPDQSPKHPLPIAKKMMEELENYFIETPNPFVLDLEKCQGVNLITLEGETIYDWCSIYASRLLGFNHPKMQRGEYLSKLIYAGNNKLSNPYYLTPESLDYFRLLYELRPKCMKSDGLKILTTNSGAEAIENMMKYMIALQRYRLKEEKKQISTSRFIYFEEAFHGRTGYAINITKVSHDPMITRDYHGTIPQNLVVPFPATITASTSLEKESMEQSLNMIEFYFRYYGDEIAGVILEPIQSSGGHRMAPVEFYQKLSELCHTHHVPLGFDEVQTAGGQTGAVFTIDLFKLPFAPTAVATAKKFGMGVLYMDRKLPDGGALDSTWCGSYVDMVRLLEEWKIIREDKLLEQVAEKSSYFVTKLKKLQKDHPNLISHLRGLGLYLGFSLPNPELRNILVESALQTENLLLFPAGDRSIRFRPPLDILSEDIDILIHKLGRLLYTLLEK